MGVRSFQRRPNEMKILDVQLKQLGDAGFEVCGWAWADETFGINGFHGILKRPGAKIPAPKEASDGFEGKGWYPDPYGTNEHRFWSGFYWTEAVADAGETAVQVPGS